MSELIAPGVYIEEKDCSQYIQTLKDTPLGFVNIGKYPPRKMVRIGPPGCRICTTGNTKQEAIDSLIGMVPKEFLNKIIAYETGWQRNWAKQRAKNLRRNNHVAI